MLLTPEQEDEFDASMKKWQGVLGLNDWRVERGQKRAKNAMAQVTVKMGARLAIYQTGDFGEQNTSAGIDATALHELLHVMLADYGHAIRTNAEYIALESAEHGIVNRLEKLLMRLA